jgi:hypothetical protein
MPSVLLFGHVQLSAVSLLDYCRMRLHWTTQTVAIGRRLLALQIDNAVRQCQLMGLEVIRHSEPSGPIISSNRL